MALRAGFSPALRIGGIGSTHRDQLPPKASPSAPIMGIDLEVKVLPEIGHDDRSEPQGRNREGPSGGSGERSRGPTYRRRWTLSSDPSRWWLLLEPASVLYASCTSGFPVSTAWPVGWRLARRSRARRAATISRARAATGAVVAGAEGVRGVGIHATVDTPSGTPRAALVAEGLRARSSFRS